MARHKQLSLRARPRTLDALVGQKRLVEQLRGQYAEGILKALFLIGPTGSGKTSIARIVALSLQCDHQEVFGNPCAECRASFTDFDIVDVNCAKVTGKADIEELLGAAQMSPRRGNYRVYILDEVHRASEAAQSMLLRYVEDDTPDSTVFILCSTDPYKVLDTLQGRSLIYELGPLGVDDITVLVRRLLKRAGSSLPADRLVDVLVDRGIALPRHIAQATSKYVGGATPQEAAIVEASAPVEAYKLVRAVIKGDWDSASTLLENMPVNSSTAVRVHCVSYLRAILLRDKELSDRGEAVAKAIALLCAVHQNAEHKVVAAALSAALYSATRLFARYKR